MHWNLLEKNVDPILIDELAQKLSIDRVLSTLLILRGVKSYDDSKDFFRPSLDLVSDPFLMKNMDLAVQRLNQAIQKNEKIFVFGDYDVDGTTSVSLVYSVLSEFTTKIDSYIPDRYTEGYGLSYIGIDYAKKEGFSLMLVLDCGTKDVDKIQYAHDLGIDIIVCDHHTPGDVLPKAVALLNPKQADCAYPYKELSACGVSYQFLCAWLKNNNHSLALVEKHLDLLAISIACDIVPVTHENRVFAHYGLQKVNENANAGIRALFEKSGRPTSFKNISDLVFVIGPRINAAGRVDHGKKIVRLLTSGETDLIDQLSEEISKNNDDRKTLDKNMTLEALEMMENDPSCQNSVSTVLYKETWHKGVVGIVASRVIEKQYKPTIILTFANGKATGSARSVKGYNVYQAISACSDLLEQYGGHMYAAGLTLKPENVAAFRKRFEEEVQKTITPEQLMPSLDIDVELSFKQVVPKFTRILALFHPFGPLNLNPVFVTKNVKDTGYSNLVGGDKKHLKLSVHEQNHTKLTFKGIFFNGAPFYEKIKAGEVFDVAYTLEENNWQGNISYEMNVKDIVFR